MVTSVTERWKKISIFILLLILLTALAGFVIVRLRTARASTYGVIDPSRAAVVITNESSDFTIGTGLVTRTDGPKTEIEISWLDTGEQKVLEIEPGEYRLRLSYDGGFVMGTRRVIDTIWRTFSAAPGQAVHFRLEGGEVKSNSPLYKPPTLLGGKPEK